MGVALLLLFLPSLPGDRARDAGAGDRAGDVHALLRRRDRPRAPGLDRPRVRGGRGRPRRARRATSSCASSCRCSCRRSSRAPRSSSRSRSTTSSSRSTSPGGAEHDDRLDAPLRERARRADAGAERARNGCAPDHAGDARARVPRLPAVRRRRRGRRRGRARHLMQGEVRLEELTKSFGEVVAVDGIDLHMPPGEFFTLLGPSGCGKTTTLRMIAGFERPTSGRIMLDGTDVAQVPPHKRNVNTVFQSYALFPHLDVADNVAFGLKYQKTKKEERRQQGQEHARARQAERLRAAQAGAALRRPAAAGRARPRARPGAARAPARRAARRPRRAAAQGPPGRAEGDPGTTSASRSCSSRTTRRRRSR